MCSTDIFLGLLALLFPPLPVWVKRGICSADSIINILLCVLGFIPGLIHAWYIIAKFPEPDYDYESIPQHDREHGHGHVYVYVHDTSAAQRAAGGRPQGQPKPQNNMSYGATNSSPPPQGQVHAEAVADNGGEGSSDGPPPPSYAAVVAGDHKVQTQD